ncbi:XPG domain containing-domain-containing protein [Aspergillus egyptiacus]|nr:XPG domain containing-domain-containing protein [Aspergillus egyptiacus]
MGIPRLRQHLRPYTQTVLLQASRNRDQGDITCIQSVVIDGPSLVYHVYSRLLSWFSNHSSSVIDALPSCDEVSRGVMLYLLHLKISGVEIKNIYFDGALPAPKHQTRLARLEDQRKKLELFCSFTKGGFDVFNPSSYETRSVKPETVLCSRPLAATYGNVPAEPFMVAAVFEDLKYRWNGENIARATGGTLALHLKIQSDFSWAGLTAMVPGEADAFCAHVAKLTDSCILTNDSDLVLHDLGNHGAVVFLDSVEMSGWDPSKPLQFAISAAMLHPLLASRRLGISSLLSLACELKARPETGLVELLRRSRDTSKMIELPGYQQLVQEYQIHDYCALAQKARQLRHSLDTRVSELFWQYEMGTRYTPNDTLCMYLPILIEDHTKRYAWDKGRLYREMGYSTLNISRPPGERHSYVAEFIRRGKRIAEERISLQDEDWLSAQTKFLWDRLESLQAQFKEDNGSLEFWSIFALCDAYNADAEFTGDSIRKLERFLRLGYMGKRLEWADIHLRAQIQAVLYSLRILCQLIGCSGPVGNQELLRIRAILQQLPPLHVMMHPASRGAGLCDSDTAAARLSAIFGHAQTERQCHFLASDEAVAQESYHLSTANPVIQQHRSNGSIPSRGILSNRFDLLQEQ